jgi:hypothetical protein
MRALVALALLVATLRLSAATMEAPAVRVLRRRLVLSTGAAIAEVRLTRYRLRLRRGTTLLTTEHSHGGTFYEREGTRHQLRRVRRVDPLADGAVLGVDTDEGPQATVTLRWLTQRTLEVTMEPPLPEGVTALGARWRSPASEAIYGLTERLRDSPPLAPGVVDIPRDDFMPVEVGSLDRRGEAVEMYVLPTIALYRRSTRARAATGSPSAEPSPGASTSPAPIRPRSSSGSRRGRAPRAAVSGFTSSSAPSTRPSSTSTPRSPAGRSSRPTGRSSTGAGVTSSWSERPRTSMERR